MNNKLFALAILSLVSARTSAIDMYELKDSAVSLVKKHPKKTIALVATTALIAGTYSILKSEKKYLENAPSNIKNFEDTYTYIMDLQSTASILIEVKRLQTHNQRPVFSYINTLKSDIYTLQKYAKLPLSKDLLTRVAILEVKLRHLKNRLSSTDNYKDEYREYKLEEELNQLKEYKHEYATTQKNKPLKKDISLNQKFTNEDYIDCMDASQNFYGGPFAS